MDGILVMAYIREIIHSAFILLACIFVTACDDSQSACNGMADQFLFGDSISHDGVDYYLYFRTSGFQDKSIVFEVYDSEPVFDTCNRTDQRLFFWGAYDDFTKKQYVKDFVLRPNGATQDETVEITYTDDKTQGFFDVYSVKFTGVED